MVRFAAVKHFASVGDTWPIDFVCLPKPVLPSQENGAVENQEVVAVSLSPTVVSTMRRICTDAGFNMKQLGLRPLASGTLAIGSSKSPIARDATVLLIDISTDEADMVVVEHGFVTFMRTVRLASGESEQPSRLAVGEIRRTLIAAMNARPGLQVQRIVLWGKNANGLHAVADWQSSLDLPVEVVDPFSVVETKKSVEVSDDSGDFASLLGLLQQHRATPKAPLLETSVDFLHPRQRPEEEKPILRYALATAAAGLLIVSGLWWYYSAHRRLDDQIAELNDALKGLEPTVKLAQKNIKDWKSVENFMKGDIQWLDQLAYVSEKALPPEKMIFRETNITLQPATNQGRIAARVDIVDQNLEPELESRLRDATHQVGSKEIRPGNDRSNNYGWTVDPEILVDPATVPDPLTLAPPKKKVAVEEQPAAEAKESKPAETPAPATEKTLEVPAT